LIKVLLAPANVYRKRGMSTSNKSHGKIQKPPSDSPSSSPNAGEMPNLASYLFARGLLEEETTVEDGRQVITYHLTPGGLRLLGKLFEFLDLFLEPDGSVQPLKL
jgi:hypothetical protein